MGHHGATRRDAIWAPWQGPGLEHLRLEVDADGATADGVILGVASSGMGERPFRLRYRIRCDAGWRAREVRVGPPDAGWPALDLRADGRGHWELGDGTALPALAGCVDVDLSASPFTNTLPIRRLALPPGRAADLAVAYVDAATLAVAPEPQRYRCLETRPDGGRYRFESLDGSFAANLPVDADGLVLDYPGLFRRVRSG